ncbi:NUDIX domain-containing protein [Actinospica durhamensis]|uniref:NUDIX domain-containing protein n=1 Tax=Actinospica durhamensis TaxID=1508375 RepID=A0A941ER35_9ACTN|nr:NUDIX domain-containing protein [Actinospica durhamensis]MBR7835816.1 NUDIX domain-containing protein [Actinospica durhamensis]
MDRDDIAWADTAGSFKYRSAGVIHSGDRLLVSTVEHTDGWFLPGGKVHFGEASAAALVRELREELQLEVSVSGAPLLITEGIHAEGGTLYQEVCFYYAVSWPDEVSPESVADQGGHRFRWIRCADLAAVRLLPPEIAPMIVQTLTGGSTELRHLAFDRRIC